MKRVMGAVVCLVFLAPAEASARKPLKICVDVQIRTLSHKPRPVSRRARERMTRRATPAPRPKARPQPRPVTPVGPGVRPMAPPRRVAPPPRPRTGRKKRRWTRAQRSRWFWRNYRRYVRRQRARRHPYPPDAFLKRLVEHYVTHEKGFVAVHAGCSERITIELYPLKGGWTAFARYSGRSQEEKVDIVEYKEFSRFAQRVVLALLYGRHIDATANLKTILKADSIRDYRTISGSHHFRFSIATAVKGGILPTFHDGELQDEIRILTPLVFAMGYRGRFNAWGIDTFVRGGVGLNRKSVLRNPQGGHVDLGGLFGVGLHFLRYTRPHGMMSFYFGGGALFDLSIFTAVREESNRHKDDRDRIAGGGLNLNFVLGFEFMRAHAAQFFIQLVLGVPVYYFDTESDYGDLRTWMPEATASVGIMF